MTTQVNFTLPPVIIDLVNAKNAVRHHYSSIVKSEDGRPLLHFTLDGNLVGDIGEALAVTMFGITLVDKKSHPEYDGIARDKRKVQVKATGTGRGPVFRQMKREPGTHLLFFCINFEDATGTVIYNGPEERVLEFMPTDYVGQRMASRTKTIAADKLLLPEHRLERIDLLS